jgi:hypothetical protein
LCPERQRHGTTPILTLKEDEPTIGPSHRSVARSKSDNSKWPETAIFDEINLTSPFFIEIFSGSGRLAAAVRAKGVTALEFDLSTRRQ